MFCLIGLNTSATGLLLFYFLWTCHCKTSEYSLTSEKIHTFLCCNARTSFLLWQSCSPTSVWQLLHVVNACILVENIFWRNGINFMVDEVDVSKLYLKLYPQPYQQNPTCSFCSPLFYFSMAFFSTGRMTGNGTTVTSIG